MTGLLLTLHKKSLNGKPRSRAKANICLEAVATLLIVLQRHMSVMRQAITEAPALLPVEL